MRFPELETERTLMRLFTNEDLNDLAVIFGNPEVMKFMPGGQPRSREKTQAVLEEVQEHWQTHGFGWWAVVHKEDERVIGWCGLGRLEETPDVELLYMLDKPYWGLGLATETAWASLRYGFEEMQLDRIVALAVPENIGSRKVMEKVGMRYERLGHYYNAELALHVVERDNFVAPDAFYRVVRPD